MNEKSCVGCKYLYIKESGYSKYSVTECIVECAKDKNQNLPSDEPYGWDRKDDNWPSTNASRCELYAIGKMVRLDVDGYNGPADETSDEEAIVAICKHSGSGRNGS